MGRKAARELGKLSCKSAGFACKQAAKNIQHSRRAENDKRRTKPRKLLMFLPPVSSQELNLSYQDLGDPFQRENFFRILRRLIRVEKLQLIDNSLTNLSSVRLPR